MVSLRSRLIVWPAAVQKQPSSAAQAGSTSNWRAYCSAARLHLHMAEIVKRFRTSAMASSPVAGRSIRCLRRYASALAPSAARSARPATALSRKAVPTVCAAALTSAKSVSRDTAANSAGSAVQDDEVLAMRSGSRGAHTFEGSREGVVLRPQREEGCGENLGYARLASRHHCRASFGFALVVWRTRACRAMASAHPPAPCRCV